MRHAGLEQVKLKLGEVRLVPGGQDDGVVVERALRRPVAQNGGMNQLRRETAEREVSPDDDVLGSGLRLRALATAAVVVER